MKKHQSRGILAGVGALLTAAALALVGGTAAHATTAVDDFPESSDVVITKLAQPDAVGDPATGEQLDDPPNQEEGIGGVTFEARLVDGTQQGGAYDIGTNAGQEWISGLESPSAPDLDLADEAARTGTTDTGGILSWNDVPRGLYVVSETDAPAGVTPSPDFFLSVPLTDPSNLDGWLGTIYVYPKNSVIEGTKSVLDGVTTDDGVNRSYTVGDDVTWTISADIPRIAGSAGEFVAPGAYRITDTFNNDELILSREPVVTAGETSLTLNEHYTHTELEDSPQEDQTTHQIDFTEAGLEALAVAVNADANAQISTELITTVMSSGQIQNSADIYPNQQAIDTDDPLEVDPAEIRYGEHLVTKQDTDGAFLAGAQFRVYLTQDDAAAAGDNYLTPATNTDGVWETDENGELTIEGLRYSDWADGAELEETDDLYQQYWLVEIEAPAGHQLLPEPIPFDVTAGDENDQTIVNVPTQGAFALPLTGGAGTAFLTIAGIAILAIVLLVVRRRRARAALAE